MKNKNVGYLIIGISILIGIIVWIFNSALEKIVADTCSHGPDCSMYSTINVQTYISLAIAGFIFLIGLFFVFAKENEKVVVKNIRLKKRKIDLEGLNTDERKVIEILQSENGAIFQRSLMEKIEIGKVKMTRILDKLESKELIERKRRGMNNIVVLRND